MIPYRIFRINYRSHLRVSGIQKKAGNPSRVLCAIEQSVGRAKSQQRGASQWGSYRFVSCYFTEASLLGLPVLSVPFLCEPLHFSVVLRHYNLPSPYFIFIHWSIVLVSHSLSCFGCTCPLFHTLAFVLSPGPALVCLQRRSTKIFLPSYCVCFVFIYQLHGLISLLISFSHFGHIDGFLCFFPLAGTTLLHLSKSSLFFI